MKKASEFKITYTYIEPKTPEEKAEQQRKLDRAFDIIFDNMLNETNNIGGK